MKSGRYRKAQKCRQRERETERTINKERQAIKNRENIYIIYALK